MRLPAALGTLLCLGLAAPVRALAPPDAACILAAGNATSTCVRKYALAIGACRNRADAACEQALRDGGRLAEWIAAIEPPTRRTCSEESAARLTPSLGVDEIVFRDSQTCQTWAEDFIGSAYADDLAALSPLARACQRRVARRLHALRERTLRAYGPRCYAKEAAGRSCDRADRDARVAQVESGTTRHILKSCGSTFDELALGTGATREARVQSLVDRVANATRHLAQQAYPPLLAPAGLFGPHPVGVRTLELADPSRPRPIEPRLLRTEVYYPADPGAVVGISRDHLMADGSDLGETPTYRDVARAAGSFPLIVYSHFGGGVRYESVFRLAHLASHGYVVASPDHVDEPSGVFDEAQFENRPLDVSFVIDELLALAGQPGAFIEGGIDASRIGAMGGSFGGYTVTALAVGPFFRGTFTDPRVKAILPQDAPLGAEYEHFAEDAPGIFASVGVATLALGGDTATSLPLAPGNQAFFEALIPGPPVMAYARLHRAHHGTFVDTSQFRGSPPGNPSFLPPRFAARIVGYLAVSFFEGALDGDADALSRLEPTALAGIDDLTLQRK